MCAELRVGTFGAVTRIFTKKNERNQQRSTYIFYDILAPIFVYRIKSRIH